MPQAGQGRPTRLSKAFRNATAKTGREFLRKVLKDMPPKVKPIQVDGGSEFKADYEAKGIDLWVLPPKSPELTGCVERINGNWSCEFHSCWYLDHENLVKMNRCVDAFAAEFNTFRPHGSLGGLTPERILNTAADKRKCGKNVGNPCPTPETRMQRKKRLSTSFPRSPRRAERITTEQLGQYL